jgi:SPP1 family phage portal protein
MATNLQQYISEKYDNQTNWFVQESSNVSNTQRVNDVADIREYLDGDHIINYAPDTNYRGRVYKARKIVLDYAKTIFDFTTSYLLDTPVTFGGDSAVVKQFQKVYKKGNFADIDYRLLYDLLVTGASYEYLYYGNSRNIQSHIINNENAFPIYNEVNEMIGFIESWTDDGISYYNVYETDEIYTFSNKGAHLHLIDQYYNASGLPTAYVNVCETDPLHGQSDLKKYISILDALEALISKAWDAYYHYITGIPVLKGSANFDPQLPENIVQGGLQIDEMSDFDFKANNFSEKGFKQIYDTLMQELLDTAHIPQAAFSNASIANVSEISLKMMYQACKVKSAMNKKIMLRGFRLRFDKIRKMLEEKGTRISDDAYDTLTVVFNEQIPHNDTEVIANLVTLKQNNMLSLQTAVENNPLVKDAAEELKRLENEESKNVSQNVPQEINNDDGTDNVPIDNEEEK